MTSWVSSVTVKYLAQPLMYVDDEQHTLVRHIKIMAVVVSTYRCALLCLAPSLLRISSLRKSP